MKFSLSLWVTCCAVLSASEGTRHHYQTQLLTPVTSYSERGARFQVRIKGPMSRKATGLLPRGTVVHGVVRRADSIGLGVKRERAFLQVEFQGCTLPGGKEIPCEATLVSVDNAREHVTKPDQVRGILAASHPHSWFSGLWFRPVPALFRKAPAGLTGAGGTLQAKFAPNPIAATAIVGARLFFFRLPEPEIEFPAGTEMILRVTATADEATPLDPAWRESDPENPLVKSLQSLPAEIRLPDRNRAGDIVNFAFRGTREEVQRAFRGAGWHPAEPLTARTAARTYSAFASMKTYEAAPVSSLYYQGKLPDLVFQKSFNSLAKRHHIRLWQETVEGQSIWLGAATHDVGVSFDWNRVSFTHRIDPHIDRERNTILNDLTDAGCLSEWQSIERLNLRQRDASDRAAVRTDGSMGLVSLQNCAQAEPSKAASVNRKRPLVLLGTRRFVLETRHYVTRGNPYYWAFRTARWGFRPKQSASDSDE